MKQLEYTDHKAITILLDPPVEIILNNIRARGRDKKLNEEDTNYLNKINLTLKEVLFDNQNNQGSIY